MHSNQLQFCGVYKMGGRLFVAAYENARGPNCEVFPPRELSLDVADDELGRVVFDALSKYKRLDRKIYPEEWEARNKMLLDFFGVSSVANLERKRKGFTIRRIQGQHQLDAIDGRGDEHSLDGSSMRYLGSSLKRLLKI